MKVVLLAGGMGTAFLKRRDIVPNDDRDRWNAYSVAYHERIFLLWF
mgnify:CR=1 FL=1